MDDLTQIKGIGPKRAADLAAMGIDTFAALAAANPDYLETTMEVPRPLINEWLTRAADLANKVFAREQVVSVDVAAGEDETVTAVYEYLLTGKVRVR
ncbi:MAG: helix-hairpin-helix domain-containing protein [Ardenticatenaceae bacterium]|nr:helix-hairpin-helix domain-containing protein [Anaerolineales bacterium]MCB8923000.1 helix-hairpin-helix domain-containing protein [Ardenticatenaceae bacterium]MCB8990267.1 helix-hairpin-helix domain-containing protein [Ardenticatenaceae bacterium]